MWTTNWEDSECGSNTLWALDSTQNRSQHAVWRAQTREMRRYAGPARWEAGRGGGGGAALSERYLEALDEEPDEDEDLSIPASERFRNELHRPRAQAQRAAPYRGFSADTEWCV